MVEQRRLHDLSHRQRPLHHRLRHVDVDDSPLGHGAQRQRLESALAAEPGEEVLAEQGRSGDPFDRAQSIEILVGHPRGLHPLHQPLEPGGDAVAGLVVSVVGVLPEELIELRPLILEAHPEIDLGHRQLVEVGEEDPAEKMPGSHEAGEAYLGAGRRTADGGDPFLRCGMVEKTTQVTQELTGRYATVTPAARSFSVARSPSPGWRSTGRVASSRTVVGRPSSAESRAVSLTQ